MLDEREKTKTDSVPVTGELVTGGVVFCSVRLVAR